MGGVLALAGSIAGCSAISPPLTETQVAGFAARISDELAEPPEPLVGALTADDAVRRAIKYNYSVRAKELEAALAESQVRAESGAMLPSIVAESDYYRRDRPQLSRSSQSSLYSTSSDMRTISRDITLSWNILDFGLSFIRAKQGLDKALKQHEEARRVTSRIIEETRSTYWRAVALHTLGPALSGLSKEVDAATLISRKAAENPAIDPMEPINYQRDLLNLQRELNDLQTSLAGATAQLEEAVGLPGAGRIRLAANRGVGTPPKLTSTADDDVRVALLQRAEIRQHMYDMRITEDEVTATLLELLPGVTFNKTLSSDTNSFLFHGNWISWGARISGNLINLVRLPNDLDAIEAQQAVHRQNTLATAAAIVMQVHVARARLAVQKQAYRDAKRFADVQRQLLQQVRTSVAVGKTPMQALAREKLASLLAETRAIVAFSELEAARAAYATAKGDPVGFPEFLAVAHMAPALKHENARNAEATSTRP